MILAIETSTPRASLAVLDEHRGEVVWESEFTSDRAHNAVIFDSLGAALKRSNDLQAVVVGTGPGSYSGVRVGIAVGNGVSLARAVPVFGISSLAALPTPEGEDDYQVIGDARRGEFFLAEVRGRKLREAAQITTAEALRQRLGESGSDLGVYTLEESVVQRFAECGTRLLHPTAGVLASIAAGLDESERTERESVPLEPIYLRAPHITVPKKRGGM